MKIETSHRFAAFGITAASLIGAVNISNAALITWVSDHSGSPLDFLHEKWGSNDQDYDTSYSNTWNIVNAGFNPGSNTIDAITIWFSFADDSTSDADEHVDISLGGVKVWNDLEVDGKHPASSYATYSMALDPLTHFAIFEDLALDGMLGYSVVLDSLLSDSGSKSKKLEDTNLKRAKIQATSTPIASPPPTPKPNRVPDSGSTFLVFGAGLLGLGGVRRLLMKA
jgi:hypothetical protein